MKCGKCNGERFVKGLGNYFPEPCRSCDGSGKTKKKAAATKPTTSVWDLVLEDVLDQNRDANSRVEAVYHQCLQAAEELCTLLFGKREAASVRVRLAADMRERDRKGWKTYGVPLTPFNGRDALQEAYEEVLDACVYLRQKLYEQQLMRSEDSK